MADSNIIKNEIKTEVDIEFKNEIEVCVKQKVKLEPIEESEIKTSDLSPLKNIYDGLEVKEETKITPQIQRSVWDDDDDEKLEPIEESGIKTSDLSSLKNIYNGLKVKEETKITPQIQRSVWDDDDDDEKLEPIEETEIKMSDLSPLKNIYDGLEVKEETKITPQIQKSVWDDDDDDEMSDIFDNGEIPPKNGDILDQISTRCITCNTLFFVKNVKINTCRKCCRKNFLRNKSYICDICNKSYKNKCWLTKHIIRHEQKQIKVKKRRKAKETTESLFECEICKRQFKYKCRLKCHMKSHTRLKPFECSKCNKKFSSKGFLVNHMTVHYTIKRYTCKFCKAHFGDENNCKKHMYRKHRRELPQGAKFDDFIEINNEDPKSWVEYEEQMYICDTCLKVFYMKSSLINHLKQPCLTKRFSCSYCNRLFGSRRRLNLHISIHTGERKQLLCNICNNSYSTMNSLKQHKFIKHCTSGIGRYKCHDCDSSFFTRYQLEQHILSKHMDQPQFSCCVCKQKFRYSASLRNHMVLHTGGFSYPCDKCNKSYRFKSSLMVHVRKKHSVNGTD